MLFLQHFNLHKLKTLLINFSVCVCLPLFTQNRKNWFKACWITWGHPGVFFSRFSSQRALKSGLRQSSRWGRSPQESCPVSAAPATGRAWVERHEISTAGEELWHISVFAFCHELDFKKQLLHVKTSHSVTSWSHTSSCLTWALIKAPDPLSHLK